MEIDDQAAFMQAVYQAHIATHGGEISKDCDFCKFFFIPDVPEGPALMSHSFILLDLSENN